MKFLITLLLPLLLAASPLLAKPLESTAEPLKLNETQPSELLKIVENWQSKYDSGKVLLNKSEIRTYEADLARLKSILQETQSWKDVPQEQSARFVNLYESLRALTDGGEARGNRKICTFGRRPGSNLRQTVCVTASEQAQIDKRNQAALSDIERNGRRRAFQVK